MMLAITTFILCLVFYWWMHSRYSFWANKNVPSPPPYPLVGNMLDALIFRKNIGTLYRHMYQKYRHFRYIGFYRLLSPCILCIDPEVVKQVFIKEFANFRDNDFVVDEQLDPMLAKSSFSLKGDASKPARNIVSPSFSVAKVKASFPICNDVAKKWVAFVEQQQEQAGSGGLDSFEISKLFTLENTTNCALGCEAACFTDQNSDWMDAICDMLPDTLIGSIKLLLAFMAPSLLKILKIKLITDEVTDFYRKKMKNIVKYRQENKIKRQDFLDAMMDFQLKDPNFDHEDLTAHTIGIFIDLVSTSSVLMNFVIYQVASNTDVQNKLKDEINSAVSKGEQTFEMINNMPYMDAIFNGNYETKSPWKLNDILEKHNDDFIY